MTVRELLKQLASTLKTHEVVTLTSASTKLYVDIEHGHEFHSLGKIDKKNLDGIHPDYSLMAPFQDAFYREGKEMYSVLDDFEVYRWRIYKRDDSYEWVLSIETNQQVKKK